jgi:SM-20-related protein
MASAATLAKIPPHLVIDDFLDAGLHADLLAFALGSEAEFSPTTVRNDASEYTNPDFRRSSTFTGSLGSLRKAFKLAVRDRFDTLFAGTGTPPFDVAQLEVDLVAHRDGDFFGTHVDTFTQDNRYGDNGDRIVSAVYYFHARPRRFTGGDLAIYPFNRESPAVIEPRDNRLVAFPSFALHEVRPIACPGDAFADARFAINCWLLRAKG